MPKKYHCDGMRTIRQSDEISNAQDAAKVFADRAARRAYGRNGYCRTIRADNWTRDGSNHTFEAFIGRSVPGNPNTTSGHNIWLTVRVEA